MKELLKYSSTGILLCCILYCCNISWVRSASVRSEPLATEKRGIYLLKSVWHLPIAECYLIYLGLSLLYAHSSGALCQMQTLNPWLYHGYITFKLRTITSGFLSGPKEDIWKYLTKVMCDWEVELNFQVCSDIM